MIAGFRIANLRSIKDSGDITIKKINILVGKNSSGKSTLLRFLPLLRQSVEQATKGPLLWYGRLVDFGSFENASRDNDVSRGVGFDFDIAIPRRNQGIRRTSQAQAKSINDFFWSRALRAKLSLLLGQSPQDRVGNVRSALIVLGNDRVDLTFGSEGLESVSVMGREITLGPRKSWGVLSGKLIAAPVLIQEFRYEDEDGDQQYFHDVADQPFSSEISAALRFIAHGRTSDERLKSIASRLLYAESDEFFSRLMELPGVSADLKARLEALGPASKELTDLRRYVLLSKLTQLVQAVDDEITTFAKGVSYIEPLRATAERYYRQQDLAVEEVDSRGANTAMFLESLTPFELTALQGWMRENLGFWVVMEPGVGHVQIKIQDGVHKPRNIADLGFGYSQILPIALQLWRRSGRQAPVSFGHSLLAMEQPELHLHPDYQAKLADVISTCARVKQGNAFRMFIETHSDHLVNRFGKLVSEGSLSSADIQVLVVSEGEGDYSIVQSVSFDSDGLLGDGWPIGFFTPEMV